MQEMKLACASEPQSRGQRADETEELQVSAFITGCRGEQAAEVASWESARGGS